MPAELPPLLDRALMLARVYFIGVVIACLAWPVVTRISSAPRWLFFRLAIAITAILWLPDLYILYRGEPGPAVAILALMHLAIALITYNCLVHIAKVAPSGHVAAHAYGPAQPHARTPYSDTDRYARRGS